MKINKKVLTMIVAASFLFAGCVNINNKGENIKSEPLKSTEKTDKDNLKDENIENQIPYIDEDSGEIDDSIINDRYKNVKKEELTYNTAEEETENNNETTTQVHLADSIKDDTSYKSVLLGYTYLSEGSSIDLTYDEAMELVKKVLPDDIEKVDYKLDKEVNKEYIYYKSSKGNFRVGLSYGFEFNNENIEKIHTNSIVGIDYSKEIK